LPPLLEAALNGARTPAEHPGIPRTPPELAAAARAAAGAGAEIVHVHAYDGGQETLAPAACAATVSAIRAACPGVPISLTTSAAIEADPRRRLDLVSAWTELPELVTANMGEPGVAELCQLLAARGVGVEAGLLSLADAESFIRAQLAGLCVRVLVEPLDREPSAAVAHAEAIEALLAGAGVKLEQVHHGDGIASWAVNRRALSRGHGIRTGLEDTVLLPDGQLAVDNAQLIRIAAAMRLETITASPSRSRRRRPGSR